MRKPQFSIITICYNNENGIGATLRSVYQQAYKDFEHIIIDGASVDRTMEIVNSAKEYYTEDNMLRVFSEPDEGLYDAMNKGVLQAQGDFICLLNGGDEFFDEFVLQEVADFIDKNQDVDLVYGNALIVYPNGMIKNQFKWFQAIDFMTYVQHLDRINIVMPCHQSIFAKKDCFVDNMFDTKYDLRAEYKWFVMCLKNNKRMKCIKRIICKYLEGGKSDLIDNVIKSECEMKTILAEQELPNLYIKERAEITRKRERGLAVIFEKWTALKRAHKEMSPYFERYGYRKVAIYGLGVPGYHLFYELKSEGINPCFAIDRDEKIIDEEIKVYRMDEEIPDEADVIIVTVLHYYEMIQEELKRKVSCNIVSLEQVLGEMWYL